MGQAKARKLKKPQFKLEGPPLQWYAEYSEEQIADHNAKCEDPKCTNDLSLTGKDFQLVAMVKNHEPKKLYLAPCGTNSPIDYQPVYVLNLETGKEIAGSFDEDGVTECSITGLNSSDEPMCLTLLCHRDGAVIAVHKDEPDTVSIICKTCQSPLKGNGLNTWKMKLAKQPVSEFPNKFCKYHGVQPIYFACIHVAHGGKEPMILGRSTADDVGLAFCSEECDEAYMTMKPEDLSSLIHVICKGHLNAVLGDKLEQYHQQAEENSTERAA
jgi:hypothetical protein